MSKNGKTTKHEISTEERTEKSWKKFRKRLAAALSDLSEDEYLIFSAKVTHRYVQFAGYGDSQIRAEAKSNTFVEKKKHKLSKKARSLLIELGWNKPTYVPTEGVPAPSKGSCNYYLDIASPVPYKTLAALAVQTLRAVYKVHHPIELQYKAFSEGGIPIRFPSLGIVREN